MAHPSRDRLQPANDTSLRGRYHQTVDGSDDYDTGYASGIPLNVLPASNSESEDLQPKKQGTKRPVYSTRASDASLLAKTSSHAEYVHGDGPVERSALQRVGLLAALTLIFTLLVILAAVAFLAFLWYSGPDNHTWQVIMVRGWLTRAVAITSVAIRTSVDLQAGVAMAMLSSLVLERGSVLLRDAPVIATTRATKASPASLLLPVLSALGSGWSNAFVAVLFLCITTYSLQFGSTVLLSDIRLGQLPSLSSSNSTAIDFRYTFNKTAFDTGGISDIDEQMVLYNYTIPYSVRSAAWLRPPPAFPTFGEYREPATTIENVDDTGVLLRALLPLPDSSSRETIRAYTGKTMVLDSRVVCQPPRFKTLWLQQAVQGTGSAESGLPLAQLQGLWEVPRNVSGIWDTGLGLECSLYLLEGVMHVCQPPGSYVSKSGGLASMFSNMTGPEIQSNNQEFATNQNSAGVIPIMYGVSFLLINSSSFPAWDNQEWDFVDDKQLEVQYTESGPWTNIVSTNVSDVPIPQGDGTRLPSINMTMTLCYSAWDTARLNVSLHSDEQRKEPVSSWTEERGFFTSPDLAEQLGVVPNTSTRGIFAMTNQSWIPDEDDRIAFPPPLQMLAELSDVPETSWPQSPFNAVIDRTTERTDAELLVDAQTNDPTTSIPSVDSTLGLIFSQILDRTGSPAQALSSMITILSSMVYYEQMPRYQTVTNSTQVYFAPYLFPQSHHGLWAVFVVLGAHVCIVFTIVIVFAVRSRYTMIGNYWQAIAQLHSPQSEALFAISTMETDKQVRRRIRMGGGQDIRVGVGMENDGRQERVGLVRRDH